MKQVNFLKRVQGLLVLLMLAFAAPMLTACGSDDDEPEASHPIVGVWNIVRCEAYDTDKGAYYDIDFVNWYTSYAQNGIFKWGYNSDVTDVRGQGTWKITGNVLTEKYTDLLDNSLHEIVYTFTLTGDRLVLVREDNTRRYTYNRVK